MGLHDCHARWPNAGLMPCHDALGRVHGPTKRVIYSIAHEALLRPVQRQLTANDGMEGIGRAGIIIDEYDLLTRLTIDLNCTKCGDLGDERTFCNTVKPPSRLVSTPLAQIIITQAVAPYH